MSCSHRKVIGKIDHCSLIDVGTPNKANNCARCQSEWVNGEQPTLTMLTPTLLAMRDGIRLKDLPKSVNPLASVSVGTHPVTAKPRGNAVISAPTLKDRLLSSSKAFYRFVKSGGKLLGSEESESRLAVCKSCPYRSSYVAASTCSICGCFLKLKSKLPYEQCPLQLWPGDKRPCGKPCGNGQR